MSLQLSLRAQSHTDSIPSAGHSDPGSKADSLSASGQLQESRGNYEEALASYRESLRMHRKLGDQAAMVSDMLTIGALLERMFNYDEALQVDREAGQLAAELGDHQLLALSVFYQAGILTRDSTNTEGMQLLDSARNMSIRISDKPAIKQVYQLYASLYRKRNNFRQALLYNDSLGRWTDSIRNDEFRAGLAKLQTQYEVEKKQRRNLLLSENTLQQEARLNKKEYRLKLLMIVLFAIVLLTVISFFMISQRVRFRRKLLVMETLINVQVHEQQQIAQDLQNSRTTTEFRNVSENMLPRDIYILGLQAVLQSMIDRLSVSSGVKIDFTHQQIDGIRSEMIRLNVYRIVQVLLHYGSREAEANVLTLDMTRNKDSLQIIYQDNGREMIDEESVEGTEWKSILSRIEYLDGTCKRDSIPGRGNVVRIGIPLK